jgi:hypothetical protein
LRQLDLVRASSPQHFAKLDADASEYKTRCQTRWRCPSCTASKQSAAKGDERGGVGPVPPRGTLNARFALSPNSTDLAIRFFTSSEGE